MIISKILAPTTIINIGLTNFEPFKITILEPAIPPKKLPSAIKSPKAILICPDNAKTVNEKTLLFRLSIFA
ncbi:hypothetical protein DR79_1890 [Francisella tularensis]|nr:hypothetical protein DR79_1890 [Francisella tularensis]